MSESLEAQKTRWEIVKIIVGVVVAIFGIPLSFLGYQKISLELETERLNVEKLRAEFDQTKANLEEELAQRQTELEAEKSEAQREHDSFIAGLNEQRKSMQSRIDGMNQRFNSGRDLFNQSTLDAWKLMLDFRAQEAQEIRNESNQRIRELGRKLNDEMRERAIAEIEFRRIYCVVRFGSHSSDQAAISFQPLHHAEEEFPDTPLVSSGRFKTEFEDALNSIGAGEIQPMVEWILPGGKKNGIRVGDYLHYRKITGLGLEGLELEFFSEHGFLSDRKGVIDFPEFQNPARIFVPFGESYAREVKFEELLDFIKNFEKPTIPFQ